MAQLFRKILCPIDFDDNSMAALDLACKVAAQSDAELCIMHVVPFPLAAEQIAPLPSDPFPVWERGTKIKLEELARERASGVRHTVETRSGLAPDTILGAESEFDADLVVMATHGRKRSAVGRFFLGSVAERVVRESVCPVLVVPPPE